MIRSIKNRLRRFGRDEDGHMLIEFALLVPLIFTIWMSSIELAIFQLRQNFLDSGLDMTARQVRLSTNPGLQHADVKQMVCDFSGFVEDCDANLRLEMVPVNIRGFNGIAGPTDCIDTSEPVNPLYEPNYANGAEHQLMIMRVCVKFKPVFKTSGLGKEMAENGDGAGMYKMVSYSAFVQEPS